MFEWKQKGLAQSMKWILDSKQAKEIDSYTIEQGGIPSLVLMERAALAVVEEVEAYIDKEQRILCLCGVGNNGGDGVAVSRILTQRGYKVVCEIVGNMQKASCDMKKQYEIGQKIGVKFGNKENIKEYNIIIDALFGIGLSRNVTGEYAELIEEVNKAEKYVISVDIPSGICANTGRICNVAIKANKTITFGYWKMGLLLYPGCTFAGQVIVAEIGFLQLPEKFCSTFLYEKEDIKNYMPKRKDYSNKGSYGKVLVIAGSKNMAGACYLSASAAYHMGTGIVKILTTEENRVILQEKIPEAVLFTYTSETLERQREEIKKEIVNASAIVIGPGLGRTDSAKFIMDLVLEYSKVPTVIDADGLQLLSGNNQIQSSYDKKTEIWNCKLPSNFILTPHLKEMSDLLGKKLSTKEIQEHLLEIRKICKENENVLVLKDARTLVSQKERLYVNMSGNHGMATAGAGDVLTGILAGLLGQNMQPFEAAALGTYIHGKAGDKAYEKKGSYSLMAQDIIFAIPEVLNW